MEVKSNYKIGKFGIFMICSDEIINASVWIKFSIIHGGGTNPNRIRLGKC